MSDFLVNQEEFKKADKPTIDKQLNTNNKRFFPIAITAVEIISIIALSALATLVSIEFKLNEVEPIILAIFILLRLFLLFFSKDVSARTRIEQGQREKEHIELKKGLKEEGKDVNYDDFNKYLVSVENRRLKIEAYKARFVGKINKLNDKINKLKLSLKILQASSTADAEKIDRIKKKIERKTTKKEYLESLVSNEYIEKNFDILKVRYKELTASQFVEVSVDSDVGRDIYSFDVEIENKKQILKGLPFCVIITLFISLIGLDKITYGAVNILQLFLDIFCVAFYFSQGWFVVGKKTLSKQRQVIVNKIALLQRYKKTY